ncbi:Rubisco LS methyltransferase, substrate-binding domain-containing protein [Cynara cardunculus var. scolymus]|uniref:Rubisco LS methyltransferase, substrate-binding domain-containing protein n=1 Tax=Cynara cardunculus var. scolymus TaxID=59895 RepID=A0A103YGH7_CYNCS|nr:Rubisco LS methyltransferase, substrate-binding domain-containing protein [Cynara cardunculus var. scolymus]
MEEAVKLENFMEWATALGISDSPFINVDKDELQCPNHRQASSCLGQTLSISYFPNAGGRGLCAVRDLQKGQLILRVPKSALMTSQSLILNDHRLSISIPKFSLSSTQILTVALLNEVAKGKRSWWYLYLTQFPSNYDILSSFDQFEIQALHSYVSTFLGWDINWQLDDATWAAEKALEKAKMEWESATTIMEELMFKPHYMSFKAWIWASASISSRTMHIPWDAAGCFCPVGDLFNYAAPGEEQVLYGDLTVADTGARLDGEQSDAQSLRLTDGVFEEESAAYCFYARRNYRKGDQVLLSYGTYTNLELLEHYGFILDGNPNDKAYVPLPSDLHSLCSWPGDSLYIQQNGKPSFALLSAMRLWATPTHLQKSVRHLAYSGSPVSNANEIIVMEWLAKKCRLVLKSLTSIKEDKSLLSVMDKEFESAMELKCALLGLTDETCAFLKNNNLLNNEIIDLPRKAIRSLDKWKLAIRWRVKYKMMLCDCISYCITVINDLS